MKKTIWLVCLILTYCSLAKAQAVTYSSSTFGLGQGTASVVGTTTNCTICGVTLNVPSGATIVVGVRYNLSVVLNSVTDTAGDTFVHVPNADSNVTGNITSLWYVCSAASNGAESFSANFSASFGNAKDITPAVYTGAKPTGCLDGNGVGTNGTGTAANSGNITTSGTNELLVGYFFMNNGGEVAGAGFTLRQDDNNVGSLYEDRGSGGGLASGTYAATGTGTSGTWGASALLLIPAPSGAHGSVLF